MDKPSLNKILGERIRYYRKNNGLSIEQFASMLNKSKSSLSKYERGEILPDIETLYKMTSILHISLMQLLEVTIIFLPPQYFLLIPLRIWKNALFFCIYIPPWILNVFPEMHFL